MPEKLNQSILFLFAWFLISPASSFAQQQFEVRHFAGSPGGVGSRDAVGTEARFRGPRSIWGDGTYLYVGDQCGSAIRRITISTGDVRLFAGSLITRDAVDAAGTDARFSGISGLWGDGSYLYVADCSNGRVRRVTLATAEVITIAGSKPGRMVDGLSVQAVFRCPTGIWGNGKTLFVTDAGYLSYERVFNDTEPGRLRKIDLATGTVSTIPLPYSDAFAPSALAGDGEDLFMVFGQIFAMNLATEEFRPLGQSRYLSGMWAGADRLLYMSLGNEILRLNVLTQQMQSLFGAAGQHDWIDGIGVQARLRSPWGLWGDGKRLFVADNENQVIRAGDLTSMQMTTLAGTGIHIADQARPPSTPSGVNWSDGVYLYLGTSRDQIWRMPISGGPATIFAGTLQTGYVDGPANIAQFTYITAIWGDSSFLYVIDGYGDRIRKVALATGAVSTVVSAPGQHPFKTIVSNNLWGDGKNLFASGNSNIFKIDIASGSTQSVAGDSQLIGSADGAGANARFNQAAGLWGDGEYLYVADYWNDLIRRVSLDTYEVTTIAGHVMSRNVVDGIGTIAAFNFPTNVWGDGTSLYITDLYSVRQLSLATNEVSTIAGGRAGGPLFQMDGVGRQARFASAGTLWGRGQLLYIEDQYRLRAVNIKNGEVVTVAGVPAMDADGMGMSARFNRPTGIWGDSSYLYVTDWQNHVVRRIDRRTSEVKTVAGAAGEAGGIDGTGPRARFNHPAAICGDSTSLYVADYDNYTIRKITLGSWQVSTFAGTPGRPSGLWCDRDYIYVSDIGAIRRISIANGEVTALLSGSPLESPLWGDGQFLYFAVRFNPGAGFKKLELATLAVTDIDSLTWPDTGNVWGDGRYLYILPTIPVPIPGPSIVRFDLAKQEMATIAGSAVPGSEDGIGTAAAFYYPKGVWGDGATLYIADTENHAIRTISLTSAQPASASLSFTISPGGSISRITSNAAGPLESGYARVRRDATSAPLSAMAVYGFKRDGILVSETGVPAVPAIRSGRIYAETSANVRTGLAIANPNAQSVAVSYYFTDASGLTFGAGSMTLDANQQIAAFLDELQRPIAEARTFTFAASQPVAAIALRGHLNERGDFLMTTLPVADLSRSDSAMVVIPHFAEGGGWTTQIALVNSSDATMTGTLVFFGQNGGQLETRTYTIAARSSAMIRRSSADVLVRAGSIQVKPDAGQRTPVGLSIFSYQVSGITITETGVPAVAPASTFAIYGENSASLKSGFAFANASAQPTTLTYEVFSSDGSAAGMSGSLEIPGNGQRALFLTELPGATALPSTFKGVVRLTSSDGSLSIIGLRTRTNERGDFLVSTTMPDQNALATTGELYLPHFVHGGGYTTEFILIGPGGTTSASGSIEFYSPSGQTLPLAIQ